MIRDDACLTSDRAVQCRHVGVAEDGLRAPAQRAPIDAVEDTHRTVSAAQTPDAINARVAQRVVEIGGTHLVLAGEIAGARQRMRRHDRLPAQITRVGDGTIEITGTTEWARWCHECNARPRCERRRCTPRKGCNRHARRSYRSRSSA
jgi:hypothetical protein